MSKEEMLSNILAQTNNPHMNHHLANNAMFSYNIQSLMPIVSR